jgi:LAO/AO transport system kinase
MTTHNENEWLRFRKEFKNSLSVESLFDGILRGDRSILSVALTLIESTVPSDHEKANALMQRCIPISGKSMRIGITGVPGVGKSTFIEQLGILLLAEGKKVAVLSIDPSSERSHGSILGDKTRMTQLASSANAYIRPTASGNSLGGVAQRTRESIIVCEAAGFDVILIETVGVGQSETAVNALTDFFLLLMLPVAGDELQGIKRGIMELADAVVITKADEMPDKSKIAVQTYKQALHLFPAKDSGWIPNVLSYSMFDTDSVKRVWKMIETFETQLIQSGFLEERRKEQSVFWMKESVKDILWQHLLSQSSDFIEQIEKEVVTGKITPYMASQKIFTKLIEKK